MIGYITLGTNDLPKAAAFYDTLLAELGAKRLWEFERGIAWGTSENAPAVSVMKPFDGQPATRGNGTMIGLVTDQRALVDQVYHKALALGGTDEGAPGLRSEQFYGAYFRDLDGNKLAIFTTAP